MSGGAGGADMRAATGTAAAGAEASAPPASAYADYLESEWAGEGDRSIQSMLAQFLRYGVLKFGTFSLTCPLETVQILRQVQHGSGTQDEDAPEDWRQAEPPAGWDGDGEGEALEAERRACEEYLRRSQTRDVGALVADGDGEAARSQLRSRLPADVSRDAHGYLQTGGDAGEKPRAFAATRWPLVLDKRCTVWQGAGETCRRQGVQSLWQGVLAGWTHSVLMDLGRATVEEALEGSAYVQGRLRALAPRTEALEEEVFGPAIVAGVAQGLVGTLLVPIEMARVRLAAQSIWARERKYSGLVHAVRTMAGEETGVLGLFRNPILAFAVNFLKPVLRILPVSLLSAYCRPGEDAPLLLSLLWLLVQNTAMCAPLLLTLPLETVRRRLLVQCAPARTRRAAAPHRPYVTRVATSATPYGGALDCLLRVLREEGVRALYQGWGFQVAAATASFATTLLAELGDAEVGDGGDAEGF